MLRFKLFSARTSGEIATGKIRERNKIESAAAILKRAPRDAACINALTGSVPRKMAEGLQRVSVSRDST